MITCPKCGTSLKITGPVAAGKKIKCPKCGEIFTPAAQDRAEAETLQVPPGGLRPPLDQGGAAAEENAFAGLGDEPAAQARKTGQGGGDKPKKKSRGALIGIIVGGVLLLSCCCTGVVGTGGYFWFFGRGSAAIVGTWRTPALEYEFRSDGKMKLRNLINGGHFDLVYTVKGNVIEVKGDTVGENTLNGQPYPTRRFQFTLSGDNLTLRELEPNPEPPITFTRRRG
jgi:predicted Zn finger-like uncharacterized protein